MGVSGIGGIFFRSKDPEARAPWYRQHLGIEAGAEGDGAVWHHESGFTVFAPFAADSDYFSADQPFMLNLRVNDLDSLVGRLESAGIEVEQREEWRTEFSTFVRIHDPEGLPLELWEAQADDSGRSS